MTFTSLEELVAQNPNPEIVFHLRDDPNLGHRFQNSASQVDTYRDCPRKWAFSKIDRRKRAEHPSAIFGSRVHSLREGWLRDSVAPVDNGMKEERVALVGLELLPMPGTCEVEKPIELVTRHSHYLGYIDFYIRDQHGVYLPPELPWFDVRGVPLVGDHKTTGNIKYAKSREDLVGGDAQAAIYAKFAKEDTGAPAVDLFWHYLVKSSRPKSVPIRARMVASQIDEQFGRVEETAKEMLSLYDTPGITAADVQPNPTACEKYGGCPFREVCQLSDEVKIRSLMMTLPTTPAAPGSLQAILEAQFGVADTSTLPGAGAAQAAPTHSASVAMAAPPNTNPLAALAALAGAAAPAVAAAPAIADVTAGAISMHMGMEQLVIVAAGPAVAAPAPAQAIQPTLGAALATPTVAAAVVPPDAPPPDLDATVPDKKTKARKAKKDARRDDFAVAIFSSMVAGLDPKALLATPPEQNVYFLGAVMCADKLIEALDKK